MEDIEYHKDIIKNNPDHLFSLCVLGHYYERHDLRDKIEDEDINLSIQYYDKILRLKPDALHIKCRWVYMSVLNAEDMSSAISIYNKLPKINTSEVLSIKGIINICFKRNEIANSYLTESYKLDPYNYNNLLFLCELNFENEEYLLKIINMEWGYGIKSPFVSKLATIYSKNNKSVPLQELFKKGLEYFPNDLRMLYCLGRATDNVQEIIDILEKIYLDNKKEVSVILVLSELYSRVNIDKAVELFITLDDYDNYGNMSNLVIKKINFYVEDILQKHTDTSSFFMRIIPNISEKNASILMNIIKNQDIELYKKICHNRKLKPKLIIDGLKDKCCICNELYNETTKNIVLILPCSHIIHAECLKDLEICPLCREYV